jgi:hypothetical protein
VSLSQKHLYLVARGGYTDSDYNQEGWQCGIRLWVDTSIPDDEGSLPTTGDFHAHTAGDSGGGLHTETNWEWTTLTGDVISPIDYLQDQAAPAWSDFMAAVVVSSKVYLAELRLYPMQGNGLAFESRRAVVTYDTPVAGGRSGDMVPSEVSLAVSWRTSRPGPRGRGRIFLPPTTTSGVAADGLVLGTMQGDAADAAQALLEGLAFDAVSPDGTHVRPAVIGSPWTNYAVITSLSVGSVFDAQRRRRRQLVETRTFRAPSY